MGAGKGNGWRGGLHRVLLQGGNLATARFTRSELGAFRAALNDDRMRHLPANVYHPLVSVLRPTAAAITCPFPNSRPIPSSNRHESAHVVYSRLLSHPDELARATLRFFITESPQSADPKPCRIRQPAKARQQRLEIQRRDYGSVRGRGSADEGGAGSRAGGGFPDRRARDS